MTAVHPEFIAGLTLNRRFYIEVVRPLMDTHFPELRHSAALIGYGSDVLGLDTPMSTDHNWGPRLQLFLAEADYERNSVSLDSMLRAELPPTFLGYSVHFSPPNLADNGTQIAEPYQGGPVNHLLSIQTVEQLFEQYLNIPPQQKLSDEDWLVLPEQKLLEVTAGELFHDGLGTLEAARMCVTYYPDNVWRLRLAAQWQRIAEEEPFVGRTGDVGDNIGSWILAARLTREIMRLGFLYARRYAPYSKWLGTAFARLPLAKLLLPQMQSLTTALDWRERERHLSALSSQMAEIHNQSGITTPLSVETHNFFGRPYQVLSAERFANAISATIQNPRLRGLAHLGAVDQFTDNVAIHSNAKTAAMLVSMYHPL